MNLRGVVPLKGIPSVSALLLPGPGLTVTSEWPLLLSTPLYAEELPGDESVVPTEVMRIVRSEE